MDILTLGQPPATSESQPRPEKAPAVAEKAVPLPVAKVVAKPIVPKQGASEDEDLDFLDSLPDPAKAAQTPENKLGKLAENAAADEEWLDDFLGE